VELIYSEHLIEHLTLEEGMRLLGECRRILLPGGVLRVATPDLAAVVTDYRRTWRDHDWLSWPEYQWVDSPARMVNTAFHAWGHRYLYDYEELALRLSGVGFEEVRRCSLGASDHPALAGLETRADSKLIVEAVAPGR
jgi:predicted SAM-dependent methyltransferase